jgi:hypothetical protein
VHLVNKKGTPITVDLTLLGADDAASGTSYSVIGGGPSQTLGDGYHPLDYQGHNGQGPVIETWIGSFGSITLEPYSANIIVLDTEEPLRLYVPLLMRAYEGGTDSRYGRLLDGMAFPSPAQIEKDKEETVDSAE